MIVPSLGRAHPGPTRFTRKGKPLPHCMQGWLWSWYIYDGTNMQNEDDDTIVTNPAADARATIA